MIFLSCQLYSHIHSSNIYGNEYIRIFICPKKLYSSHTAKEVPRPKTEGMQAPSVFGRKTSRGTPFTPNTSFWLPSLGAVHKLCQPKWGGPDPPSLFRVSFVNIFNATLFMNDLFFFL